MIDDNRLEFILSSEDYQKYIPELLEGIQDMNWPNANQVVQFLKKHLEEVVPSVRAVLSTDDAQWIYWILTELVSNWPRRHIDEIVDELKNITNRMDIYEETNLVAIRILLDSGIVNWIDISTLILMKEEQILKHVSVFSDEQINDYKQIEVVRLEILSKDSRRILEFIKDNDEKLKLKNDYETFLNYLESLQNIRKEYES